MTDYSVLVQEAINKAHQAVKDSIRRFEIGKTYFTSSVCDHNCVYSYEVISRTAKTVTLKDNCGTVKRRKINTFQGSESVYPEGVFSMCPVLKAG